MREMRHLLLCGALVGFKLGPVEQFRKRARRKHTWVYIFIGIQKKNIRCWDPEFRRKKECVVANRVRHFGFACYRVNDIVKVVSSGGNTRVHMTIFAKTVSLESCCAHISYTWCCQPSLGGPQHLILSLSSSASSEIRCLGGPYGIGQAERWRRVQGSCLCHPSISAAV